MVEGDGLENRYARKGIVGSNPTPSATYPILLYGDHLLTVIISSPYIYLYLNRR